MSNAQEYLYSFRMYVPDKSPEDLCKLRDEIVVATEGANNPFSVSCVENRMTISLLEKTEFPDERLSNAFMMAKSALASCGVQTQDSWFFEAFATPDNPRQTQLQNHIDIVKDKPNDARIDLSSVMYHEELAKLS